MRTLKNMMMGGGMMRKPNEYQDGGKMPKALVEYFEKKNKAAMGMKYQDGGGFLTKEEFERIEDLKRREQGLPDPMLRDPRATGEMSRRDLDIEADRLSDPYGYYSGQIERSNPRVKFTLPQHGRGVDYREGGPHGIPATEGEVGRLIERLGSDNMSLVEKRRGLRQQIASQYSGEQRDNILTEFDNETAELIFADNRRRMGR